MALLVKPHGANRKIVHRIPVKRATGHNNVLFSGEFSQMQKHSGGDKRSEMDQWPVEHNIGTPRREKK